MCRNVYGSGACQRPRPGREAAGLEREDHQHYAEYDGERCDQPEEREHALSGPREQHYAEEHGHDPGKDQQPLALDLAPQPDGLTISIKPVAIAQIAM
jgi:hypothetical protein